MIRYLFIALIALTIKVVKYGSVGYGLFKTGETLAQNYSTAGINADGSYEIFKTNEPTNLFGNRKVVFRISTDFKYNLTRCRGIYIDSVLHWANPTLPSTARIAWINTSTKKIEFSSLDSLHLDYNKLKNKPAMGMSTLTAGFGEIIIGSAPNQTVMIDSSLVPTLSWVEAQMTLMESEIQSKQSQMIGNGLARFTGTNVSYDNTTYLPSSSYSITNLVGAGNTTVTSSGQNFTISSSVLSQSFQPETDPTVSAASKTISASDITNWNGKLSSEVDGSVTNEIQTLSLIGNTVSLTGGGSFVIPTQTTALTSSQVTTALGFPPLQTEVDGSTSNEIQTISLNQNTVTLSNGGGSFTIPTQTTALTSSQVTAALSYVPLQTEVDGSVTNEIQTVSGSGTNTLTLSNGGGTYVVPTQTFSAPGISSFAGYGTGTAYALTGSSAKIDMGTTDPVITLTASGTYLILSNLKLDYASLTTLGVSTSSFKLRRTNNTAADIPNATTTFVSPVVTLLTAPAGDADIQGVLYTTSTTGDIIEMWGNRGTSISVGNINVSEAWIVAVKLY